MTQGRLFTRPSDDSGGSQGAEAQVDDLRRALEGIRGLRAWALAHTAEPSGTAAPGTCDGSLPFSVACETHAVTLGVRQSTGKR